jgi:hypothetical protein
VENLIEQLWYCALTGCALSLVVAAAWSQPVRFAAISIFPRVLLAGVPTYLSVNYLLYQDPVLIAAAGTSFMLCFFWLRGWWLPRHSSGADLRLAIYGAFPRGKGRAALASTVLRRRVHRVVRGDRRLAKAA